MATYFSVTSAICDPNNLLALSLGYRLTWGMLCTLINTTIKYTPHPGHAPCRCVGPARLARTINVTDTHANCALPALSYLIYSCNLHTCHGQGRDEPPGRGCVCCPSRQLSTSACNVQRAERSTAECVCLMLLIDFQSQLTGPSHSASPQHAVLCTFPLSFPASLSPSPRLPFLP